MVATSSGWYPDPMGPPGQRRFWDGQGWTAQIAGAPSSGSGKTVIVVVGAVVGAFVLLCGILGAVGLAIDDSDIGKDTSAEVGAADVDATDPDDQEESTGSEESVEPAPVVEASEPTTEATVKPKPKIVTFLVSLVVDGDTVELDNGETVRLAGIDTPERGECGHQRAADALSRLILDKRVRLVESDEDRDKYDRLLRYVDVGKVDAGLQLIKKGLAIARYDSRDGYGRHPREDRYIAADQNSPNVKCEPKPEPFADPGQGAACEPGYNPCVPLYPPDLNCADVGPVTVTGDDPHRLDGDGDGRACGDD